MQVDVFSFITRTLYILAAAVLLVLSLSLIVSTVWIIIRTLLAGDPLIAQSLRSIGMVVIGIAVFDVAKFLIEEEVLRNRELRSSREARQSLTKFMTIIVIATSLEGLVLVFQVDTDRIDQLLYPILLLAASVLALVGLSLFIWFSRISEAVPGAVKDEDAAQGEARQTSRKAAAR